jgi:hypothetical protein
MVALGMEVEVDGLVVVGDMLGVEESFFTFPRVVQAESDTRAVAARHAMISFFISRITVCFYCYVTFAKYGFGYSFVMGCNPNVLTS